MNAIKKTFNLCDKYQMLIKIELILAEFEKIQNITFENKNKLFIACAECRAIYRKNDTSTWIKCIGPDGHEKTYCYLCAQDLIKVCSICNRKIHIGWIKQMKNGNLICLDCYGKLCLDDFITGKIKHLNYHEME